MKMRVVSVEEAEPLKGRKGRSTKNSVYNTIYKAIDNLESGQVLVVDLEDSILAKKFSSVMSIHCIRDNKIGKGRFNGLYYSKNDTIILIGKK